MLQPIVPLIHCFSNNLFNIPNLSSPDAVAIKTEQTLENITYLLLTCSQIGDDYAVLAKDISISKNSNSISSEFFSTPSGKTLAEFDNNIPLPFNDLLLNTNYLLSIYLVRVLDAISDVAARSLDLSEFLRNSHPDSNFRDESTRSNQKVASVMNGINSNLVLYNVLDNVIFKSGMFQYLTSEEQRITQWLKRDFQQSGIFLEDKSEYLSVLETIHNLSSSILSNINQFHHSDKLYTLETDNNTKKKVSFQTINQLSYTSPSRAIRQQCEKFLAETLPENIPLFESLFKQRNLSANILGFDSFSHFTNTTQTCKSPNEAWNLLDRLARSLAPKLDSTLQSLAISQNFTKLESYDLNYLFHSAEDQTCDTPLYTLETLLDRCNQMLKDLFSLSFSIKPTENGEIFVKNGIKLEFYDESLDTKKNLGTCFLVPQEGNNQLPAALFSISSAWYQGRERDRWDHLYMKSPSKVGKFLPKPSKRPIIHIGQFVEKLLAKNPELDTSIVEYSPLLKSFLFEKSTPIHLKPAFSVDWMEHCSSSDSFFSHDDIKSLSFDSIASSFYGSMPISVMCGVLDSTNPKSLLSISDIELFFHEFGHAVHQMVGYTEFQHHSSTRTSLDFVETPSTLFEHFVYDFDFLQSMKTHDGLVLNRTQFIENHRNKNGQRMFNVFSSALESLFDQSVHRYWSETKSSIPDFLQKSLNQENPSLGELNQTIFNHYSPFPSSVDQDNSFTNNYHLLYYPSAYYSYIQAKLFACQIWSHCFDKKVQKSSGSMAFRQFMLEFGGSLDPLALFPLLLDSEADLEIDSLVKDIEPLKE